MTNPQVQQLAEKHYENFCESHDGFVETLEAAIREAHDWAERRG